MPTREELKILQALPLEMKVRRTKQRIKEWVDYFGEENCRVSFSGGKDSTVLLHLVRSIYPNIRAVFVNTGLEYPEIQRFAKSQDNVTVLRPTMQFGDVIKKYGYPFISKEVSSCIFYTRKFIDKYNLRIDGKAEKQAVIDKINELDRGGYKKTSNATLSLVGVRTGTLPNNNQKDARAKILTGQYKKPKFFATRELTGATEQTEKSRYNRDKWFDLVNVDFVIGNGCCGEMKEKPLRNEKSMPFIGLLADESERREQSWLRTGCNAFDTAKPSSKPLSFWTRQDILKYIKQNNLPIASVYGDIVYTDGETDFENTFLPNDCKLRCTGCQRTGCIFCGYGAHLDEYNHSEPRFVRLKRTHPRQYEYCMYGGSYDSDGLWKPDKNGLGMKHCIDEINKIYGNGFIKY